MAPHRRLFLALCFLTLPVLAQPTAAPLSGSPIPRDTLQSMYRAELGPLYNPADADRLYSTHELIEKYFSATSSEDRKALTKSIDAVGLDPNLLGRLCRIRMSWPDLQGGVYYVNEKIGPHDVHYFLGIPNTYDRTKSWPLFVKLPTPQVFITEPRPNQDQVAQIYTGWIKDELSHHADAIVLMPLLNLTELYGPGTAGMNTVIQPILHAAGRVNIDPARVYMLGHAMAAHAVWNFALHYPTYFAAVAPLAGGASSDWQRVRLMCLRNVLPVVWHDADDQSIPVASSRDLVRLLRGLKIDVDYTETKGVGHAPTDAIAESVYAKLRARTRDLYPTRITLQSTRPDTLFNRIDWVQVYQALRPGQDRRLIFRHGTSRMILNENSFRIDATRPAAKSNRVDINEDNVESMRLYFNDRMIDFSQPLTINVNRKTRFEGLLKRSTDEMLKDQLFLGRGWRYFTAVVDIDLSAGASTTASTTPSIPSAQSNAKPATRPAGKIEIISPDGTTQTIRPGSQGSSPSPSGRSPQ